jgi:prepilin signal peptidase PulO-like enzyme (type II secretory pathway)
MINLYYFFLPLILTLGIITSYTDIKEGKIRNKHLIIISCIGLLLYCILFFAKQINNQVILLTLINLGIGTLVGVFLWFFGFWSAGDAKLFASYLFIIPLAFYKIKIYTYLILLLNVVIPVTLFFIIVLIFKTTLNQKRHILSKYLSLQYIISTILVIFSIGWLTQLIFGLLHIPSNLLFNMFVLMGIDMLIRKIWRLNILYIYGLISTIRFIIEFKIIFSLMFWYNFIIFVIGYTILRGFVFDASYFLFSKEMKTEDLKTGMILAENINKKNNKFEKVALKGLFSTTQIHNKDFLLSHSIEGLSEDDIITLKKNNIDSIKVQQTIPFAPFMFVGALIICVFGLDIVNIVYHILIR